MRLLYIIGIAGVMGPNAALALPDCGPASATLKCDKDACCTNIGEYHAGKYGRVQFGIRFDAPKGEELDCRTAKGVVLEGGNKHHVHVTQCRLSFLVCEWYAEGSGPNHDNG